MEDLAAKEPQISPRSWQRYSAKLESECWTYILQVATLHVNTTKKNNITYNVLETQAELYVCQIWIFTVISAVWQYNVNSSKKKKLQL